MADIYRNAYLTIAVSLSANSLGGCFSTTRPDLCLSFTDNLGRSITVGHECVICLERQRIMRLSEIDSRSFTELGSFRNVYCPWRILYCNYGEFAFTCLTDNTCECGNTSFSPHVNNGIRTVNIIKTTDRVRIATADEIHQHRSWHSIVMAYMRHELTKMSDILPAISGCARIYAQSTKDEYLAGLWARSFTRDLLWLIHLPETSSVPKPRPDWTAPSWSWASISLGQTIFFLKDGGRSTLETLLPNSSWSVECVPNGSNDLGELLPGTGTLKVKSSLFPCFIQRMCKQNADSISHSRLNGWEMGGKDGRILH
jgi:hypothetical protein